MLKEDNIYCRLAGHKFVRTIDNKLYYVETCLRCGKTAKHYYRTTDTNVRKHIKR